jgi:hypothetical protein
MANRVKSSTVRKVEDVSKGKLIACKILLLAQNLLVNIELCAEGGDMLCKLRFVGL